MEAFVTLAELEMLFRPLSDAERTKAQALLAPVSDLLRQAAKNVGKDLDAMIAAGEVLASVVQLVTVDVVTRVLRQNTVGEPLKQESQTAMGYNWQGTYAIPGGGIAGAIMNNDLKRLGLRRRMEAGCADLMREETQ